MALSTSKNRFVDFPIIHVLQMLRKSVETRDWLNTIEPRNVRAVMKRVIEDISAIDTQVGQLYEEIRGRNAAVTPAGAPTPRVTACPPPKERDSGT